MNLSTQILNTLKNCPNWSLSYSAKTQKFIIRRKRYDTGKLQTVASGADINELLVETDKWVNKHLNCQTKKD